MGCDESSGWIWYAARVLATHLHCHHNLNGLRVLELGSGTGWLALTLARAGAIVTATERKGAMPLLTRNVYGCLERIGEETILDVTVWQLHWEDDPRVPGEFDLVIGSDLFYLHEYMQSLVNTLVRHDCRRCIFTYEERKPEEEALFLPLAMASGFSVLRYEQVDTNQLTGNRVLLVDMVCVRGKE